MFGRLVDMATRTLIIDLSKGTGGEPMYGMVTVQRTRATSEGTFEVLPWETKLKLFNGIATITEAVTDGSGPFYDSAYLIRVQNGYCAPRWGFMAALPDGTTPISTGDMPKVNPITGEGIYMDAQEWNALYGALPDRVSATETRLGVLDGRGQRGYTVTQTTGRTVTIWDYLNQREQIVYGDTGWRAIDISNTTGTIRSNPGNLQLRRQGNIVTARIAGVSLSAGTSQGNLLASGTLPLAFRGVTDGTIFSLRDTAKGFAMYHTLSVAGSYIRWLTFWDGITQSQIRPTEGSMGGEVSWVTDAPWPTSLPGVAA